MTTGDELLVASNKPAEESTTRGGLDHVLDYMKAHQVPLTRANYLALADLQEPLEPEIARSLPKDLTDNEDSTTPVRQSIANKLLLTVDLIFQTAVDGPLMREFNSAWSAILDAHEDDVDWRSADAFEELCQEYSDRATSEEDEDFEGGPGGSTTYRRFFK